MAKLSPVFNDQTFDVNGNPASGYLLFTYVAGSSTKQATYTDEAGSVPQSNPIILDSLGWPTDGPIWLLEGQQTKFVLAPPTDTDPPTSPVRTIDNVSGVGDNTVSVSQWLPSGVTPVYVSANSFTLIGDQTSDFQPGRRLRFTVSGGTVYGNITASVFTSLTTVTMQMDGVTALDSGLSVVNLSILTASPSAEPSIKTQSFQMGSAYGNFSMIGAKGATIPGAATISVFGATDGNVVDVSGSGWTCTSFGTSPVAGYEVEGTFLGAGTLTQSTNLNLNIGNNAVFNGTTTGTNVLTVNSITSGTIDIGDQIVATGITSGGVVTAFLTGTGGVGTYTVSTTQNVGPLSMTGVKSVQVAIGDKYRAVANTTSQIDVTLVRKNGGSTVVATAADIRSRSSADRTVTPQSLQSLIVSGTPVATTSGTTIDFTNIPAWAKRITVMLDGVSLSGTDVLLVQVGDSGGVENTGYVATAIQVAGSANSASFTAGFGLSASSSAANTVSGVGTLTLLDAATNTWAFAFSASSAGITGFFAAGTKSLSATLDRVRVATTGANTFDAGKINILYE